jgi:hypothetical protein
MTATWRFGDDTEAAELHIKPNGRLAEVRISRWGNPEGAPFRRYPFGVRVEAESRFGGITIPSVFPGRLARERVLPGRDHRRGFQLRRHR